MIIYVKDKSFNKYKKGDIIVSDFQELNKVCSLYGIVHIYSSNIPDFVDCIYAENRDELLEKTKSSVIYNSLNKKWCGMCHELRDMFETKYCNEKCCQANIENTNNSKNYVIENMFSSTKKNFKTNSVLENRSNKKEKVSIEKNSHEKFQTSMIKEAVRLEYALKRESYKKEIRQPSLRKTVISNKKTEEIHSSDKICKSVTRKGEKCTNKALENSDYCGILSHRILE